MFVSLGPEIKDFSVEHETQVSIASLFFCHKSVDHGLFHEQSASTCILVSNLLSNQKNTEKDEDIRFCFVADKEKYRVENTLVKTKVFFQNSLIYIQITEKEENHGLNSEM